MKVELPYVVFEVTSACNLRCRYCYNIWKRPGEKDPNLNSYRLALRTLKQLFRRADVSQVTMTGGEPLLAERFFELVLFCRRQGKTVNLISNGSSPLESYQTLLDLGVALSEADPLLFSELAHK